MIGAGGVSRPGATTIVPVTNIIAECDRGLAAHVFVGYDLVDGSLATDIIRHEVECEAGEGAAVEGRGAGGRGRNRAPGGVEGGRLRGLVVDGRAAAALWFAVVLAQSPRRDRSQT